MSVISPPSPAGSPRSLIPDAIAVAPATYNPINKWATGASDTYALGVLAEQTTRYIEVIDLLLREVQAHSRELDIRTPEEFHQALVGEATHQYLTAERKNLPQAHSLSLVDANGTPLNTSRDLGLLPNTNAADRDVIGPFQRRL